VTTSNDSSQKHPQRILVYKRTHIGDPDEHGRFGIEDCMRSVRGWKFDGVLGVGGIAPWKSDRDIARKVNWVGRFPIRVPNPFQATPHPLLKFASTNVKVMEALGPLLADVNTRFAKKFYKSRCRFWVLDVDDAARAQDYLDACHIIEEVLADNEQGVIGRRVARSDESGGLRPRTDRCRPCPPVSCPPRRKC
jgi:hypothetical protein